MDVIKISLEAKKIINSMIEQSYQILQLPNLSYAKLDLNWRRENRYSNQIFKQ